VHRDWLDPAGRVRAIAAIVDDLVDRRPRTSRSCAAISTSTTTDRSLRSDLSDHCGVFVDLALGPALRTR